jgi:hypothetical protein
MFAQRPALSAAACTACELHEGGTQTVFARGRLGSE